jgi:hypothetical protein
MEESHNMIMKLVCIDSAEQAKQDAIFSYNIIDLINLPCPFQNPHNPCPVAKSRVRAMRNALLEEGFRVFSNENRIMIVISPSDVEPACITTDPTPPPRPFCLKMGARLTELTIIGGQHCRDAILLIQSEYNTKMGCLWTKIESKSEILRDFLEQPPETEAGAERKDKLEQEIKALELELADH